MSEVVMACRVRRGGDNFRPKVGPKHPIARRQHRRKAARAMAIKKTLNMKEYRAIIFSPKDMRVSLHRGRLSRGASPCCACCQEIACHVFCLYFGSICNLYTCFCILDVF